MMVRGVRYFRDLFAISDKKKYLIWDVHKYSKA